MLDMGFIRDIEKIISALPPARQTLLFSATLTEKVSKLGNLLNNPVRIGISPKLTAAQTVRQSVYEVDSGKKSDLLIHLFNKKNWGQVLIFTRTRHGANRLVKKMVHSVSPPPPSTATKHSEFAPALWRISRPTKSVLW